MTSGDNARRAVRVGKEVYMGLETVRASGLTNMFDRLNVARVAASMSLDACARWVRNHRALYGQGVLFGFEPDEGD